jgi:glycine/D-amino acid oxidase-like deaminating enzyme
MTKDTNPQNDEALSYWSATATPFEPPPTDVPASTDVAIIGGGYTGVSAARALARRGASVDVFEARRLGWGASTRNGGMMIVGLKYGAETLVEKYGESLGRQLFEVSVQANRFVEELIQSQGVDCDYHRVGHMSLAAKSRDYDLMKREAECLEKRFGHGTRVIPRGDIVEQAGSARYHGALVDDQSAGLHPAKYFHGLARAAARAGARLHPNTPVEAVDRVDGGFRLRTPRGEVRAREVLVATNGYTPDILPDFKRRIIPLGSYIVVTESLDPAVAERLIPRNRMLIDTKHILYYWRRTPDDRLLFGGRVSFTPATVEQSREFLSRAIAEVYPELAGIRIEYTWSGNVGFTFDLMPHVGRHENQMHYAMGFCGHGVAMGSYLGAQIGEMIGSEAPPHQPFASIPFPSRFYYNGNPWFLGLAGWWYKLLDRV